MHTRNALWSLVVHAPTTEGTPMRDYGKVLPQYWIGETGRRLRAAGRDAQLLGLYLLTCPSANMLGLYYLPLPLLAHEIGMDAATVTQALARIAEAGFAYYDAASEMAWIPEMARFQLGSGLKKDDNRVRAIHREYQALPAHPFLQAFYEKYRTAYHLEPPRVCSSPRMAPPYVEPPVAAPVPPVPPPRPVATTRTLRQPSPRLPLWPSAEALMALYNEAIPADHPKATQMSPARQKKLDEYLKLFPDQAFWKQVCRELSASSFLRGACPGQPGHPAQKRGLDWLLQRGKDEIENCLKVYEGKYRDPVGGQGQDGLGASVPKRSAAMDTAMEDCIARFERQYVHGDRQVMPVYGVIEPRSVPRA